MDCPKCQGKMEEISYGRDLVVDRCTHCQGLWFDTGEAEALKGKWMSDALIDTGDPALGRKYNDITKPVRCPRCEAVMIRTNDKRQPHIIYELCEEHGLFFDAGEFKDYKYETFIDKIRDFFAEFRK
ncbi:MAG: zf-TFIIB domain-containing protein [Gammaproteobacteria bacterium]|nr:zf-TFIIB domain-containing protein [Gammaproteobacteria bacterium]